MTWRSATQFEQDLLTDATRRWPDIIPLARVLTLAQRIEPLLLRNARRRFAAGLSAETESQLWFSPLVSTRNTQAIVLHQGIARILADQLRQGHHDASDLESVWSFTQRHTRHWSVEERLERDLRYYALVGDEAGLTAGLRDILRLIGRADGQDRRLGLARLVKRTLPIIAANGHTHREGQLLANYAGLALGDSADWAVGSGQRLPAWLESRLPPPIDEAELAVAVHYDLTAGKVLHFRGADPGVAAIAFPSPLPARLHIAADGQAGQWHSVAVDSRIRVHADDMELVLTVLDGRQWRLDSELPSAVGAEGGGDGAKAEADTRLVLSYVEADREQAEIIARWLHAQGLRVELSPESDKAPTPVGDTESGRVVRLWTSAAQRYWSSRDDESRAAVMQDLLLRTEDIDIPQGPGVADVPLLDWRNWQEAIETGEASGVLERLQRWLQQPAEQARGAADEEAADDGESQRSSADHEAEIAALIKEIEDPDTEPPRRLKIGDRLAELGDPREGVGVREIEVPVPALRLVIEEDKYGIRVVRMPNNRLAPDDRFVLVASGDVRLEKIMKELPRSLTIAPIREIARAVSQKLPGIRINALPVAPLQIPYRTAAVYFELDQGDEAWAEIEKDAGLAFHVADDMSSLEFDMWVIDVAPTEAGESSYGTAAQDVESPPEPIRFAAGEAPVADLANPDPVQQLLDEINDPATEPPRRLTIGDELVRLGDPRKGVGLDANGLPDIDWVEIPGGPFIYQDGETHELPTFWISRYPITARQFQAFVHSGAYANGTGRKDKVRKKIAQTSAADINWWQGLKKPKSEILYGSNFNCPRAQVDWYEAVAFSRWLSQSLSGEADTIQLPTEQQWEKAARGEKGLIYPWGNEYQSGLANVIETTEKAHFKTTAVGLYPQGRSPYQVHDLSGNVWEWCLNKYHEPDTLEPDESDDVRVLRGGSYIDRSDLARADFRNSVHPGLRRDLIGFRVVSSVPIAGR